MSRTNATPAAVLYLKSEISIERTRRASNVFARKKNPSSPRITDYVERSDRFSSQTGQGRVRLGGVGLIVFEKCTFLKLPYRGEIAWRETMYPLVVRAGDSGKRR